MAFRYKQDVYIQPNFKFIQLQQLNIIQQKNQQIDLLRLRSQTRQKSRQRMITPLQYVVKEPVIVNFIDDEDDIILKSPFQKRNNYFDILIPGTLGKVDRSIELSSQEEEPDKQSNDTIFVDYSELFQEQTTRGIILNQLIEDNFKILKFKLSKDITFMKIKHKQCIRKGGILRDVRELENEKRIFREQLLVAGTGFNLQYFDSLLEAKYGEKRKGCESRLRQIMEIFCKMYVSISQGNK